MHVFLISMLLGSDRVLTAPAAALEAFPGAEGFGAASIGGRGGQVIKVTNLNDSGPGSLRQAVQTAGPRIVVFEVSGNIALKSKLTISKPYITIAGQTAPGDGICLKDYAFQIAADQTIVRYMRFRLGDNTLQESDTVTVSSGRNIILDHCSVSWSVDEALSTDVDTNVMGNLTVQWCMITESLNCSIHSKGCHGYGSLLRGGCNNGYSFHHNLYAHHMGRSPRPGNYNSYTVDPAGLVLDFRNNVVYNWSSSYAGYNADTTSVTRMNFVGNYYKRGPNSSGSYAFQESCSYSEAYFSDNLMSGICPTDPWTLVKFSGFTEAAKAGYKLPSPLPVAPVTTEDALTAYAKVLAGAGASFPERDAVDARVINDVLNGIGKIINDEDEVGGWPELNSAPPPTDTDNDGMPDAWELACGLNPYNPRDAGGDRDGDGYTNIEEYVNWLPLGQAMPAAHKTDVNADGIVDLQDFAEFAEHYSCSGDVPPYDARCDFDADGRVSFADLFALGQDWLWQRPSSEPGNGPTGR